MKGSKRDASEGERRFGRYQLKPRTVEFLHDPRMDGLRSSPRPSLSVRLSSPSLENSYSRSRYPFNLHDVQDHAHDTLTVATIVQTPSLVRKCLRLRVQARAVRDWRQPPGVIVPVRLVPCASRSRPCRVVARRSTAAVCGPRVKAARQLGRAGLAPRLRVYAVDELAKGLPPLDDPGPCVLQKDVAFREHGGRRCLLYVWATLARTRGYGKLHDVRNAKEVKVNPDFLESDVVVNGEESAAR
ncbi:hypothetical protein EVG20_g4585 [Dentipellis fragilis]|uniref:Uncharacterized protein n=1 Tax=Dentipellis fragilis TaxID=205917 RepID=A0A4Y9YY70_9AGAM|nr:hypothetical protein EVG20_g4585 [Dentipellis fragilis]